MIMKHGDVNNSTNTPISAMVEEIVGCKWSIRLLLLISQGKSRPSLFLKNCPGLSAKVMNERLKKMMNFGILARQVKGEKPPIEVSYTLTPFGKKFMKIIKAIRELEREMS